jgi:hypothetical protein
MYIGAICKNEVVHYFLFDSETHEILETIKDIDDLIKFDSQEQKRTAFGRGNVKFYIYPRVFTEDFDVDGVEYIYPTVADGRDVDDVAIVLVITGSFKVPVIPEESILMSFVVDGVFISFVVLASNPGILCLFKCLRDEVENDEIPEHLQVEIFNYIRRMPAYLSGALGKFSGWVWAKGTPTIRTPKLVYLSELMRYSYNKCPINSADSCVSTITTQSGARKSIIGQESCDVVHAPLFNPLKKVDQVFPRKVESFILGRRVATIYDAFSDGLLKIGKEKVRLGLRSMLAGARSQLLNVGNYECGHYKIFHDIYGLSARNDNNSSLAPSMAYYNRVKDYAHVEHKKKFAELFLCEELHSGAVWPYQLAALCLQRDVNLEIYEHSTRSGPDRGPAILLDPYRFFYDESQSTIMVMKCGANFQKLYLDKGLSKTSVPDLFYCVLEYSSSKSKSDRCFKDQVIFYTLSSKAWEVPTYNESLVMCWKLCIFEVFSDALKALCLIDTSRDIRWLLSESQSHILNVLERIDSRQCKVFQTVYLAKCAKLTSTEYLTDPVCVQLDHCCGGRNGIHSTPENRKLFSYLYLVNEIRSPDDNTGTFQLAALCNRFEVNLLIYTQISGGDNNQLDSSGKKYYYGEDFINIVIVQKNGQYGFQDYRIPSP